MQSNDCRRVGGTIAESGRILAIAQTHPRRKMVSSKRGNHFNEKASASDLYYVLTSNENNLLSNSMLVVS